MRVVGTAGHVDHGKSTLVSALTGINPDRLKEEQDREMTIELGFAWLTLPDGQEIGIVDVPGHRDFIENMLAGVGGIDAVIFVVAADEGVMPQTKEHLAILDLLQIQSGVIALTKTDLIDDVDWLDMVIEDVRSAVSNTILAEAPILPVSAQDGKGLEELLGVLQDCLSVQSERPDFNRARLPIDRVFSIAGFGTVVTGTLLDGILNTGDDIEIMPGELSTRIRGLQTHKQKVETVFPGSRTAVNLTGVDANKVHRGDVLVKPGSYQKTGRIDAHFRLLKDASQPVKHDMPVKLFLGASEVQARLRLIGKEEIIPGEVGWIQLETKEPLVTVRGDRYILRRPSPGETLGGGTILEPHPGRRHKRFSKDVINQFEMLLEGSPQEVFYQDLMQNGYSSIEDVVKRTHLSDDAHEIVHGLFAENKIAFLNGSEQNFSNSTIIISNVQLNQLRQKSVGILTVYHQDFPLRMGMPREELKSRLKLASKIYNQFIDLWVLSEVIQVQEAVLSLHEHEVNFTIAQQKNINQMMGQFAKAPYATPSVKDSIGVLGEELYNALLEQNELVQVSNDVVFRTSDYESMLQKVAVFCEEQETISVAQFRDLFSTSRKYALGFLEYLDKQGVTIRVGDARKLRKKFR